MLYRLIDLFNGAIVPLIAVLIIFGLAKKASARKTICIALFTLYLAAMFDIVGLPYMQTMHWKPVINLIPFSDLFKEGFSFWVIFQFAANIIMFIPFGVFLPLIWKRFRRFPATLTAGALTSLWIELAQLFSPRVTAADDLLLNTLGAAVGYFIIAAFSKKSWKKSDAKAGGGRDGLALLLVIALVSASSIFIKYYISNFVYGLPLFH